MTPIEPSPLFPNGVVPAWVELFAGDRDALFESLSTAVGPLPGRTLAEDGTFTVEINDHGAHVRVMPNAVRVYPGRAPRGPDHDPAPDLLGLARAALAAWIYSSTPDIDPRSPNRKTR